jgi:hypothetical protein
LIILKKTIKLKISTLKELLDSYKAPKIIDYFSLDADGSEENILTKSSIMHYVFLSLTIERVSKTLHELLFQMDMFFLKINFTTHFIFTKNFLKKRKNFFYLKEKN